MTDPDRTALTEFPDTHYLPMEAEYLKLEAHYLQVEAEYMRCMAKYMRFVAYGSYPNDRRQ